MNNYTQILDSVLKIHLQETISLCINNKLIKTGKFILYNFYDYHIEVCIINKNKIKKIFLPIPFKIEHYENDKLIYFDYRIKSLYNKLSVRSCENKYYNNILEIQFE